MDFYPRSPCGERPNNVLPAYAACGISIHALLAESDNVRITHNPGPRYFYPRSPCGERQPHSRKTGRLQPFLSTLSLRRATFVPAHVAVVPAISIHALLAESDIALLILPIRRPDFYPRSPCGERPPITFRHCTTYLFLSTLSLRRATVHYDNYNLHCVISIHALLAESDHQHLSSDFRRGYFYPRSPCGERRL